VLRRSEVPIVIEPGFGFNAAYQGPFKAHVKLGPHLVNMLTRDELKAVIAHELGHRELYHVERCWVAIAAGYALGVLAVLSPPMSWWWCAAPLAGLALAECFRVWHEFEADAFAMRTFGAKLYRSALLKVVRGDHSWRSRWRLRFIDWVEARGG
jgi:hypothetical protein